MRRLIVTALAAVALAAAGCAEASDPEPGPEATPSEPPQTILEEAAELAGAGELGDDGTSLFLDGEGSESDSGTVTVEEIGMALGWAEAPDHVMTLMSQTRALDGMQTADWETEAQGTVTAQWTYHPDNGLDIILTVGDE